MAILLTCGDPHGIGLELLFRALADGALDDATCRQLTLCVPSVVAASYGDLLTRAGLIPPVEVTATALRVGSRSISLVECPAPEYTPTFGIPSIESGRIARAALEYGAAAMRGGQYDALVTLPVSKEALHWAGFPFAGQTEFFGHVAGCEPLMVLACQELRVALVTIHVPLEQVPPQVTFEREVQVIEQFHRALVEDFGMVSPRIAVLGLNPHAGEHGLLGEHEERIIAPAIAHVRQRGIAAHGPFAADGFFARGHWRSCDGVVAQYHDQGLIPLKMLAQGKGVNITAGLPFVRTSPDHGTAFDIVGTGRATYASVLAAIAMAQYLATNRRRRIGYVSPS